ncbi:Protein STIP1 [Folsomia candida]|uniref:Protein STIP1 n=1 Tax=Folsomia candida TaxID=158441 RepID=A0A226F4K3_FOLCA|nr:Protein STIP1 [Folsomia candida]
MGPKKMQPPQNGDIKMEWINGKLQMLRYCEPTEEESILLDTKRRNVISAMNRVHRDVLGPLKLEPPSDLDPEELMLLACPTDKHSTYDESMEVELKMENCVSIETLVKNVGQVLKGKFLLCRTITPSSKMVGVDAGVEDVEGKKAMRLALFNYSVDARMGKSDFEAVLPLGTMLIVKNPVFKRPSDELFVFGLIVENPADVEILSPKRMKLLFPGVKWKSNLPNDSRYLVNSVLWEFSPDESDLEIATKLKNVANKAFVENRSTDAIRFYDLALEYLPVEEEEKKIPPAASILLVDILSNKAAALIKLDCFNPALICTGKVLEINNAHVKAIYRHAKALIGLGRYSEGGEFLDEKLKQHPSLGDESKDILRLRSIVSELGKPPAKEIVLALLNPAPRNSNRAQPDLPVGMMDRISEFRGPIQLAKSKIGEGEGLFATQDLEPGEVLLVCRPFAAVFVPSEEHKTFSLNSTTRAYLVGLIANKIRLDPELGRDIYTMWAGPDLKSLTENEDLKMTKVDITRIENICKFNSTSVGSGVETGERFISTGVWISSSKINHSCIDSNAMYRNHDSSLIMMVTTFKRVKKGEEILVSYVDAMRPLPMRNFMETHGRVAAGSENATRYPTRYPQHNYPYPHGYPLPATRFICKCRLCELDRSESPVVIAKRDKLLKCLAFNPVTHVYQFERDSFARDLDTIAEVERLRAATPDLNYALTNFGIYVIADLVLLDQHGYANCMYVLTRIYALLQNVPIRNMHPDVAATILVCCMRMGQERAVLRKWTEELRKYCRLYTGTLEYVRAGNHPTIPEELTKFGIEFFTD